jgi:hypothetical protein
LAGETRLLKLPEQFRHAIEIARRQRTKWWELRAATTLVHLLSKTVSTPVEC